MKLPVSISIGIGVGGSLSENDMYARSNLIWRSDAEATKSA